MIKKNYIVYSSFILILACIAFVWHELSDYYSFANKIVVNHRKRTKSDTLVVVFIGDSWAAYHSKYDQQLKRYLESRLDKPAKVISRGTVGAKTKYIYTAMHDDSPTGTKKLIERYPRYAIISAGINDAVAKMGTDNYCHHYNLIIKELISVGIKPIIIDMPQIDYMAVYKRESFIAQIRHHISSWLTDAPLWTFEEYRQALISLIIQNKLKQKIIFIPASEWNPNGYIDSRLLYEEDNVHLNEKGYCLLDSCITSYICNDIQSTHDFQ